MVTTRSQTNSLPAKRASITTHGDLPARKRARKVNKSTNETTIAPQKAQTACTSRKPHLQPQATAAFFDLPAELRNEIYSLVLTTSVPFPHQSSSITKPAFLPPALLAVNRQFRAEVSSMRAGEVLVHINGSAPAVKYLRGLPPRRLFDVREVCILSSEPSTKEWALQRIRQLEKEFGKAGLRKYAVRFFVEHAGERKWMSLYDLKRIEHLPKAPKKHITKAHFRPSAGVWCS